MNDPKQTFAIYLPDGRVQQFVTLVVTPEGEHQRVADTFGGSALEVTNVEMMNAGPYAYVEADALVNPPPAPAPYYTFDFTTKTWTTTLADAQAAKWEEMKTARDVEEYGGFVFGGNTYDSGVDAVRRIHSAVLWALHAEATGIVLSIDWTLADNTVVTLTEADMIEVGAALGEFVDAIHDHGRVKRAEIAAATTVAEVEAIVW